MPALSRPESNFRSTGAATVTRLCLENHSTVTRVCLENHLHESISVNCRQEGSFSPFPMEGLKSTFKRNRCLSISAFVALVAGLASIIYGSTANALSLLAVGFFGCFTSAFVIIGLYSAGDESLVKRGFSFQLGRSRYEVLFSFANGIFFLFTSLFVFAESLHHILEPEPFEGDHVFLCVLLCVVSSCVCSLLHSRSLSTPIRRVLALRFGSTKYILNQGHVSFRAFLRMFWWDTACCTAAILSTLLCDLKGWWILDALFGLCNVVLSFKIVSPMLSYTGGILLHMTPRTPDLEAIVRQAASLPVILECYGSHFWTFVPGVVVGSIHVRIRAETNEQDVLMTLHKLFQSSVQHFTVSVHKDPSMEWWLHSGGEEKTQSEN